MVALVKVDFLSATCLASEFQRIAIGPKGSYDVAATLAEIYSEDGGHPCL